MAAIARGEPGVGAVESRETREPDSATLVPRPDIVAASDWGSKPQPIPDEVLHTPTRITLHHAGVLWKPGDDPVAKIKAMQAWGQRDKGWPDLPYHFMISPDGTVFQARDTRYAGETNTSYDTHGHLLIQCWGNFEEQRITAAQLASAARLAAYLFDRHGLPREQLAVLIAGHNDVAEGTSCPGRDFDRYIDDGTFTGWVVAILDRARALSENPEADVEPVRIELKRALKDGPTAFATQVSKSGASE